MEKGSLVALHGPLPWGKESFRHLHRRKQGLFVPSLLRPGRQPLCKEGVYKANPLSRTHTQSIESESQPVLCFLGACTVLSTDLRALHALT